MPSTELKEQDQEISLQDQQTLLAIARQSIQHGLENKGAFCPDPSDYSSVLRSQRCSFVTLHLAGQLRGCIGQLMATQTLVLDVAEHAYAAAFRDPRFAPLSHAEFGNVVISISVLSPPKPLACANLPELLATLRPGTDGLILEEKNGFRRATYLPSVWQQLPDPEAFLDSLKRKAGLPSDIPFSSLNFQHYQTFEFHEPSRD